MANRWGHSAGPQGLHVLDTEVQLMCGENYWPLWGLPIVSGIVVVTTLSFVIVPVSMRLFQDINDAEWQPSSCGLAGHCSMMCPPTLSLLGLPDTTFRSSHLEGILGGYL